MNIDETSMNKREFLKSSAAFLVGGMWPRLVPAESEDSVRKNWAGNYRYSASRLDAPTTVAEVQTLVKNLRQVKALGSRHSFNSIADSIWYGKPWKVSMKVFVDGVIYGLLTAGTFGWLWPK